MSEGVMPTSYLIEKLGNLAVSKDRIEAWSKKNGGSVGTEIYELDWIRQNAESIVRELDEWRNGPKGPARIVCGETWGPLGPCDMAADHSGPHGFSMMTGRLEWT